MSRRALAAAGACLTALGVACTFVASGAATTACTTHQCDTDFVNIDQSTGTYVGDLQPLGPGIFFWESGPIDATWIDFPGQRTYFFLFPAGFTPTSAPLPYVATGPNPTEDDAGESYVLAGGQLAELGSYVHGGFKITNGTCQEYYLYVTVTGTYDPPAPAAPNDDGGTD